MLDVKFIRENPNLVKEAARKKHIDFDVEKFLDIDKSRRGFLKKIEDFRAKQNSSSERIAKMKNEEEKNKAISGLRDLKLELMDLEEKFKKEDSRWRKLLLEVPNIPDLSVPEGKSDADNVEIKKWGTPLDFSDFKPKDHIDLMRDLDLIDLERGAKVAGFRGYFLKNEGATLSFALWQFALENLAQKGFEPFIAPSLLRPESFIGTGYLPQGKEELYATQDTLYLTGTAEVPMMGFYRDEILEEKDLPKKFIAFSPCFRREAGSYGKDTKGIFRVHEFLKLEQIILCRADHEESVKWHEAITQNAEELLQALKIPYRVVLNCGADLGLGQVKKYDIEVWTPSENKYRESHSSSYFHDFQTRRLNIRYRTEDGAMHFVHSLNNTAIATPRILIALLENYQQKDGSVAIPEVLRKYVGKEIISR